MFVGAASVGWSLVTAAFHNSVKFKVCNFGRIVVQLSMHQAVPTFLFRFHISYYVYV